MDSSGIMSSINICHSNKRTIGGKNCIQPNLFEMDESRVVNNEEECGQIQKGTQTILPLIGATDSSLLINVE